MKLTIKQINVIEDTLVLNGLKFEDLKLEIIDHIASEIEVLMEENALSFEENLKFVFNKWKIQLQPSSSFWIRNNNKSIPKIVVYKCNKIVKRILFLSFVIGFSVATLIVLIIKRVENEELISIFNLSLKVLSILVIMLLAFARYKVWKSRHESTYGYLFNKNGFLQIINLVLIAIGVFRFISVASFSDFHFMPIVFPMTIFCVSIFYLNLAYNHLKFNRKMAICQ